MSYHQFFCESSIFHVQLSWAATNGQICHKKLQFWEVKQKDLVTVEILSLWVIFCSSSTHLTNWLGINYNQNQCTQPLRKRISMDYYRIYIGPIELAFPNKQYRSLSLPELARHVRVEFIYIPLNSIITRHVSPLPQRCYSS